MQLKDQQPSHQDVVPAITLSRLVMDDIFKDFTASRRWVRRLLEPLAWPSVYHFARIAAHFDKTVAYSGFGEAMRQVVSIFANKIHQTGIENVPERGPLLVVSNHPGTCDSLTIAASLPRDDLKIIAAGFSLLRRLPNASRHLIFTDLSAAASNFSVVRTAIRHLQSGGALLIFPSGKIDPDPAVLPGALEALRSWSPSIEMFLRKVPQIKILFTAVSGVLEPAFLRHPLTNLLSKAHSPEAVAGTIQTIAQMVFKGWVQLKPAISFGIPMTMEELRRKNESLYQSMIDEASQLLAGHLQKNKNLINMEVV